MRKNLIWIPLFLLALSGSGQDLSNFTLVRASDGQHAVLTECLSCAGVVVIFTSPDCPFDRYYADRMRMLQDNYAGRISFFFVDPSQDASTTKPFQSALHMYLDSRQQLLAALDARKTPEAFLLKKKGTALTLIYRGAIDDNAQVAGAVTQTYLQSAMDNLLAGKEPDQLEIRAGGCTIRKR